MKVLNTYLSISLIAFLLAAQTITAQCHIDDWKALKALYDSTNGDNWENKSGWDIMIANQSSPPANCNLDDLDGVIIEDGLDEVITEDGRVKHLSLIKNRLNGNIPPELANLTYLKSLYLKENELIGSIPPEFGNLIHLSELDLKLNELTGAIPPEFGNLTKLSWLYLERNQLSGSIPPEFGNLTNLFELSLGNNQLTGAIPIEFGNLTNLYELSLGNNQLTGTIPAELGYFTNLDLLRLNDNQFLGCYPGSLTSFCNKSFSNENISEGNNFDAPWEDFCTNNEGACSPLSTNSYYLQDEIDFVYDHSTQSLNIVSSSFPIKNIALYNTNGQMLRTHNIQSSKNINLDVSDLANGLYVIVATMNEKIVQTKFTIIK